MEAAYTFIFLFQTGLGRGRRSQHENQVQVPVNIAESANVNLKLSKSLVMSSFHELQDQFLLSYENGTIDDNEFSALQEEFMQKKISISHTKNITVFYSKR